MTRVLLVSRSLTPPWDEASKNFARVLALRAQRVDVTILNDGQSNEFPAGITQLPLYTKPHLDWSQRFRLLRLRSQRNAFDVLHYLFTPTVVNATLFRTLLGGGRARSVQTIASLNGRDYTPAQARRVIFADRVVTYSEYSRSRLEALGIPNVQAIQPGIDLTAFAPRQRNDALAEQLGISADSFVLMYPGEYVRLGAVDSLVAILPRLVEAIPNVTLVLACRIKNNADAEKKREITATLEAAGLLSRVVFTDTVRDMPSLYNVADVMLFAVENMIGKFDVPLAVIEAMACEKPVVISDLPVLAEFTSDETAVVVRTGDRDHLVSRILELHADPAARARIGKAARKYTKTWFDIEQVAERYEQVYESLASTQATAEAAGE
jgi:glycosyltransferase involved in cell wall biosynthesis